MKTLENEDRIIASAKEGDMGSLKILLGHYAGDVYGLCYKLCGNRPDAEDISQEALLRVMKSLKHFDGKSRFLTWVYRIAANLWIDVSRRRKKIRFSSLDSPEDPSGDSRPIIADIEDTFPGPDQIAENIQLNEEVRKSLDALAPEQKLVIVLKYQDGKSLEEISQICGLAIGTISARISRGVSEMRKKLQKFAS